ncbi:acyl-CoA dehydrogenase family protein [Homoserinimonas sp. OAct 916]|uniref:acyl-CoA dehydrogenase family protein n=1 Tax=Homoserinimonas sp. OAct 916 TaxID=2211450 RepID=UPI000DBE7FA8|nr:acyl-CoA dehydrogenase family protein [Homoserinimonas sp. OAct 916]
MNHGVSALLNLPDIDLPAAAVQLRSEVREFLTAERAKGTFIPHCDAWHTGFDPAFSAALGERGWLGISWPTKYGGHQRSVLERFVVTEELLAAGAPVAAHWVSDRQSGPGFLRFGTEEQRQRFLPGMAAGEIYFALGISEPEAGSDLSSLVTRARRADGGWILNGTKTWTSHAHQCHFITVLCRTSQSQDDRHAGFSQLIVDLTSPGVIVRPIRILDNSHHFNEVMFDNVFVPDDLLLGEEGAGWSQISAELALERSGPERFMSNFPLLEELVAAVAAAPTPQGVQAVGELVADFIALRRMSLTIATAIEAGENPSIPAALVKDTGTRFEQRVPEVTRAVFSPVQRAQNPSLAARYEEAVLLNPGGKFRGGTNEVLRGIVAKGLGL